MPLLPIGRHMLYSDELIQKKKYVFYSRPNRMVDFRLYNFTALLRKFVSKKKPLNFIFIAIFVKNCLRSQQAKSNEPNNKNIPIKQTEEPTRRSTQQLT